MEAKALANTVRISPIKARLTIDMIRGKDVNEASNILKNTNNKAARLISKVLNSSVANAVNNLSLEKNKLYVKEAYVNQGPVYKRTMADSRGRSGRNDHRTSHIVVVVSDER